MELRQTVIDAIRQICGAEDIRDKSLLKEDLGIDSLGMVTLLVLLEDAFSIEFDESDMDPFDIQTVEDVFELVQKYAADGADDEELEPGDIACESSSDYDSAFRAGRSIESLDPEEPQACSAEPDGLPSQE